MSKDFPELEQLEKRRDEILRWAQGKDQYDSSISSNFVNTTEALAQITQALLLAELLDEIRLLRKELKQPIAVRTPGLGR